MKYHVNPETGNVGPCAARFQCRFGPVHYESKQQAQHAYERKQSLISMLSAPGALLPSLDEHLTLQCYEEQIAHRRGLNDRESDVLGLYASGSHRTINSVLRGQDVDNRGRRITDVERRQALNAVPILDAIIARVKIKPRVVYRFIDVQHMLKGQSFRAAVEALAQRGVYSEAAFMSTSAAVELPAYRAAVDPNVLMLEVATDRGVPMQTEPEIGLDVLSREHEILLPRNSHFEVVGIEWDRRVEVGELSWLMMPSEERENECERQVRNSSEMRVPTVKLVQVD